MELRWLDDGLRPLSEWRRVVTWSYGNHNWSLLVDQMGRALVLSFFYPPSFGPPAPPSEWKFSAQWMGPDGPIGPAFQPATPIFTPDDSPRTQLFATFGSILTLPSGGFAAFAPQAGADGGGSVAPSGWYALYPSGEARVAPAPDWLATYDGSLQLLASGKAFTATTQDPVNCSRTVQLIALSGRLCSTLKLDNSAQCQWNDTVSPDGTIFLENRTNNCRHVWWPGLARL